MALTQVVVNDDVIASVRERDDEVAADIAGASSNKISTQGLTLQ